MNNAVISHCQPQLHRIICNQAIIYLFK